MDDKLVRLSDVLSKAHNASAYNPKTHEEIEYVAVEVEDIKAIPAVDAVPMDFHDRCMQIEIRKRHDLERFVKWVMDEIFSENWEDNRIAFDELACRKLVKMGYVAVDEENDLYYRKDEPEDE